MTLRRELVEMAPRGILLIYLLFGGVWILLSDQFVRLLTDATGRSTAFQTAKGLLFVLASGALILVLIRYREGRLSRTREAMKTKSQETRVLKRILRHNIRNDLNVITGYIENASDRVSDDVSDDLEQAQRTAEDLLEMTEKIRTIDGIELEEEAIPEPVEVTAMLRYVIDRVRRKRLDVRIESDLPEASTAQAGPALRYAITEIVENAIEHHDGTTEELVLTVELVETADTVRIRIGDNGPGIPDIELDAFERGEELPLTHGSGVGLWLVKWVCDVYGGSVSVESEPTGSTVSIDLQRAPPPDESNPVLEVITD